MSAKARILIPTLVVILIADILTKRWALDALGGGERIELFGGLVPLTLAFNKGAAFSISLGGASRWVFHRRPQRKACRHFLSCSRNSCGQLSAGNRTRWHSQ